MKTAESGDEGVGEKGCVCGGGGGGGYIIGRRWRGGGKRGGGGAKKKKFNRILRSCHN